MDRPPYEADIRPVDPLDLIPARSGKPAVCKAWRRITQGFLQCRLNLCGGKDSERSELDMDQKGAGLSGIGAPWDSTHPKAAGDAKK